MLITHSARKRIREKLRTMFGGKPCRLQVGALPWRLSERGVEIMLVTSRGTGRWVLPKGWPEKGEALHEAAAREAGEEAGLAGAMASQTVGSYYYDKELPSGLEWRCEVHVYPLEVDQVAERWPERKKRRREWFTADEAARRVREPDLGEIIAAFAASPRKIAA